MGDFPIPVESDTTDYPWNEPELFSGPLGWSMSTSHALQESVVARFNSEFGHPTETPDGVRWSVPVGNSVVPIHVAIVEDCQGIAVWTFDPHGEGRDAVDKFHVITSNDIQIAVDRLRYYIDAAIKRRTTSRVG